MTARPLCTTICYLCDLSVYVNVFLQLSLDIKYSLPLCLSAYLQPRAVHLFGGCDDRRRGSFRRGSLRPLRELRRHRVRPEYERSIPIEAANQRQRFALLAWPGGSADCQAVSLLPCERPLKKWRSVRAITPPYLRKRLLSADVD
jgi:hypothetical protein